MSTWWQVLISPSSWALDPALHEPLSGPFGPKWPVWAHPHGGRMPLTFWTWLGLPGLTLSYGSRTVCAGKGAQTQSGAPALLLTAVWL